MKNPLAIILASGAASASSAATSINFEVSNDNAVTWSSSAAAVPGQTIYVRMRVQLTGATSLGLSGLTCQPVLSNWSANDVRNPFTFPGVQLGQSTETAYDGRPVADSPATNTGRIFPFGSGGQGVASSSGLLTSFVDNGNRLRFAGSKCTTETINPAWGLAVSQQPQSLSGTNYNPTLSAVVFRYSVTLGQSHAESLVASVVGLSGGVVKWYLNAAGTQVFSDSDITINPGTIIIPSPGAAVFAGLGAVLTTLRPRRFR
jgi:hypothetical protein